MNANYQYRDILKDPPSAEEIQTLAKLAGLGARELVNPKSTAFKALNIEFPTNENAAELLSANPKAMIRPLLTDGQQVVLGFKPEEMNNLIK